MMARYKDLFWLCVVICWATPSSAQGVMDCTNGEELDGCLTDFASNLDQTTTFAQFRQQICEVAATRDAAQCILIGIAECDELVQELSDFTSLFPVLGQIIDEVYDSIETACSHMCESHNQCIDELGANMICTNNVCACGMGFVLDADGVCVLDTITDDDIVCPSTPIGCSFETRDLQKASSGCRGYCQCSPETTSTYYWQGKACAAGTTFDTTLLLCNYGTTCEVTGQICSNDEDCQSQENDTFCHENTCTRVCSSGTVDANGDCPTDVCTSDSGIELNDAISRSERVSSCPNECTFKPNRLSDDGIEETWYSSQKYRLGVLDENAAIGDCGTYYPIYLKEPLPATLADDEMDVAVVVVGLEIYGDYDYQIKVRRCGDAIQYRLPAAPVKFAAYCLDPGRHCIASDDCGPDVQTCVDGVCTCPNGYPMLDGVCTDFGLSCLPAGSCNVENAECDPDDTCICMAWFLPIDGYCLQDAPAIYYIHVNVKLNYYDDLEQNMHIPYMEFTCVPQWSYNKPEPSAYYIVISWYVDNTYFKKSGVLTSADGVTNAAYQLTEMELMEAGYKLGVQVNCGIKIALTQHGLWATEQQSYGIHTGISQYDIYLMKGDTQNLYHPYFQVPFGCTSTIGAQEPEPCEIIVRLADSIDGTDCSSLGPDGARSPHCSMRLPGITKYDWDSSGGDWQGHHDYWDHSNIENTQISSTWGLFVRTNDDEEYDEEYLISLQAEHQHQNEFWNDYKFPDVKVHVYDMDDGFMGPLGMNQLDLNLEWHNNASTLRIYDWQHGFEHSVQLVEAGEYIIWRSSQLPFQMHITVDSDLRPCGVIFRLRNSVYAVGYRCDGVGVHGVIYGQAEYTYLQSDVNSAYLEIDGGYYSGYWGGDRSSDWMSAPRAYSDGGIEGIAGMYDTHSDSDGTFLHRDGIRSGNEATFVQSWRVDPGDSLLNPANHYDVMYEETKKMCGCPRETAFTTDDSWTHTVIRNTTSYTYINNYNYLGEVMCSNDDGHICTTTTPGSTVWRPSLIPEYSLKYINVIPDLMFDSTPPTIPPVLTFNCNFSVVNGYLYTVTWLTRDAFIDESGLISSTETKQYRLTADMLYNADVGYTLDSPIQCAAKVHSLTGAELLSNSYSDTFVVIEVGCIRYSISISVGPDQTARIRGYTYRQLNKPIFATVYQLLSTDVSIGRAGDSTIPIRMNVPFGCLPLPGDTSCELKIIIYDPDDSYDCKDATIAVRSFSNCGTNFQGIASQADTTNDDDTIGKVTRIAITTKNNNKYKLRREFQMQVRTLVRGLATSVWTGELASAIKVTVVNETMTLWQRKTCHANNDPRIKTGDGVSYSNMVVGESDMYRHKILPIQVQIKTVSCNGGWASCICAVTARQGRDIYTVNYCGQPIIDYISLLDGKLDVYEKSCTRTMIVFAHGTVVEISVSPWRSVVNVIIWLSPGDVGNIEGLCGEFNGDPEDDFTRSDGTVDTISGYWWWWWGIPDDFSKSWELGHRGVLESESLLNPNNTETDLWDNVGNIPMCVCPNNGLDEPLCSINEDDTCTVTVARGGIKKVKKNRESRSTRVLNPDMDRRLAKARADMNQHHAVKRQAEENPDSISVAEARVLCEEYFQSACPAYQYVDDVPFTASNETLQECAQDVALNPSVDWQGPYCEVYVVQVEQEIQRDREYQESNVELAATVKAILCPSNCNGHGTCVQAACVCDEGYGTDECLLDVAEAPELNDATGGGVCDISVYGVCNCILLMGSGFVPDAQCKISETRYMYDPTDNSLTMPQEIFEGINVEYSSLNEVYCCVEDVRSRRRRAATDSTVELGQQLGMYISNNGVNYSNPMYVFVLDSTCMETLTDSNGLEVLVLKAGFCYIGGSCVSDGISDVGTTCHVCRYTTALFDWTPENCPTPAVTTTTSTSASPADSDDVKWIVPVAVCSILAVTLLIVGGYVWMAKYKKASVVQPQSMEVATMPSNVGFRHTPSYYPANMSRNPTFQQAPYAWMEYGVPANVDTKKESIA